jgi:hypothetical protein
MALFETRQKNQFWYKSLNFLGKPTARKTLWTGYTRYAVAAAIPFAGFLFIYILSGVISTFLWTLAVAKEVGEDANHGQILL